MDASALLSHILHQTRQNVEFLINQKQITPEEGQDILRKIPSTPVNVESRTGFPVASTENSGYSVSELARRTSTLNLNPSGATTTTTVQTTTTQTISAPPYPPSAQDPPVLFRAKALWDYSQDPADLSFRTGQIIHVTAETNADWWTGYVQDEPSKRTGLFPSNYVERIPGPPPPNPLPPQEPQYRPPPPKPQGYGGYQPSYQPPSGPPPPQHGGYSPYPPQGPPPPGPPQGPPPVGYYTPAGPVVQAPPPAEEPKKSKFGGMGNTLATSAVGGLGFGAGSAVGSGIVNSLF